MTPIRQPVAVQCIAVVVGLCFGPLTTAARSEEFRLPLPELAGNHAYGQSRGPVNFDLGSALASVASIRVEITGTFSVGWWDGDDVEDFYHGPRGSSLYLEMNHAAAYPGRWVGRVDLGTNGPFSRTITLRPSVGPPNWEFLRDGVSDLSVSHAPIFGWGSMPTPPLATVSSLTLSIEAERAPEHLAIRASPMELCWPTASNSWYQLQYRSSLNTNQWAPFGAWFRGTGSLFCTNDAALAGQTQRFFQVARTNAPPP